MRKFSFYLIYLILVLAFAELILRFCFPIPELQNFNRVNYQVLDVSAEKGSYLRGTDMLWKSIPDTNHSFVHVLNNYGFRDQNWKIEKSEKKRVFVLGDSFTEGMMAEAENTIPASFDRMAQKNGEDLEVFNCGMMGIGLKEYLQFIQDAVPVFKPDELILVFYSNDMPFKYSGMDLRPYSPKSYSVWEPRLLSLIQAIEEKNPIPFRFTRNVYPFFKAVPDARNPWTFKEQELKPHVRNDLAEAMKKGNLNYYRPNWYPKEVQFLSTVKNIDRELKYIRDFLKKQNCEFRMVYIPGRHQVSDYYYSYERAYCQKVCPEFFSLMDSSYQIHQEYLTSTSQKLGIPFQDLSELIRKEEASGNHLYWNYDDHMRGRGYNLLGRAIYDEWNSAH